MVSKTVQLAFGLLFLFVFVFAMSMTSTQKVNAEDPPGSQFCCGDSGWCAQDSSLTKWGWPDDKNAGVCTYSAPPPLYAHCYVFFPICAQ